MVNKIMLWVFLCYLFRIYGSVVSVGQNLEEDSVCSLYQLLFKVFDL